MPLGTKPLTSKPGEFSARCRLGAWRDVAAVLTLDPPLDGAYPERWNRTLERSEMLTPCDFETTDRAAFDAHMAEVHGRKLGWLPPLERGWDHGLTPPIRCRKPVRLKAEGQSFKARDDVTRTCSSCGLVAEVTDNAGELWWAEHERGCSIAAAAS